MVGAPGLGARQGDGRGAEQHRIDVVELPVGGGQQLAKRCAERLRSRGRQALRVMRSNSVDLEKRWEHVLGRQRMSEFRETLQILLSAESGA